MDTSVTGVNLDSLPAQQKQGSAAATGQAGDKGLFAEQLARIQAQKNMQEPTQLTLSKEQAEAEEETEEVSQAPKIARSWRMADAEKATEVHENLDLNWDDVVDLLNPLQHIPIVGTIYRELTGDKISPEIQIAGSVAFGALTGSLVVSAIAGIAGAAYEESTGEEATVQIAQAIFGEDVVGGPSLDAGTVQVAALPFEASQQAKTETKTAHQAPASMLAAASTGGMRVGNVIYASPTLRSAARVSAAPKVASADVSADVAEARAALDNIRGVEEADGSLGVLMHRKAAEKQAGTSLPPELVHDMMLMALDKYKAAEALSSEEKAFVN